MIQFGQFSNLFEILSIFTLSKNFRNSQLKLNETHWWQSQTEVLSTIKGTNSKIDYPIWPVFESFWDFVHVHLIDKFQEDLIKTEWLTMMTKSSRGFFSNQWDAINVRLWPFFFFFFFFLFRHIIHVHLVCKFQEHPLQTEWVRLMTKSNRSFFRSQRDVTLR